MTQELRIIEEIYNKMINNGFCKEQAQETRQIALNMLKDRAKFDSIEANK